MCIVWFFFLVLLCCGLWGYRGFVNFLWALGLRNFGVWEVLFFSEIVKVLCYFWGYREYLGTFCGNVGWFGGGSRVFIFGFFMCVFLVLLLFIFI